MADIVEFRRPLEAWQSARCPFTGSGRCEAHVEAACRCLNNSRILGRERHDTTPELHAIARGPWHVDLSDPDLIAFAKTGGPIPPPWDTAPGC